MVDVQPTENLPIDPPPPAGETPLMGNPILTRRSTPGRSPYLRWYIGVPVAVIVVCGVAYAIVAGNHSNSALMTNTTTTTAMAPAAPTAPTAPVSTPAPAPAPLAQATPEPAMAPVQPPARLIRQARAEERTSHRSAIHRAAAAADDTGSDASATSPNVATPPPAMTAPPSSTPAPAPVAPQAAPPVITPPPAQ